jgi:hypothetical protein
MWDSTAFHLTLFAVPDSSRPQIELCVSHIAQKKARYPDFLCAALSVTACAAFIKESRMKLVRPTGLNRKSGGIGPHPLIRGTTRPSAEVSLEANASGEKYRLAYS